MIVVSQLNAEGPSGTEETEAGMGNYTYEQIFNESGTDNATAKPHYNFFVQSQFITALICLPIICTFGIIGNILSLIVLQQKKMSSSTNTFLSAMAIADLIKLINDEIYFVVILMQRYNPEMSQTGFVHIYPYSHYVFNGAMLITSWLTVSVAVERYISVCHPHLAKSMCTIPRARLVSSCVALGMSIIALPSAFKYHTVVSKPLDNTSEGVVNMTIELTSFGKDEHVMNIYTWIQTLLRSIIPLFVLVFINASIIRSLGRSKIQGAASAARYRITVMLVAIIVVFLICITPDAIMSTFLGLGYYEANYLVRGIREFTDLLLAINSAVNFVLYCTFSKVFRETFMTFFCNYHIISNQSTVSRTGNGFPDAKHDRHESPSRREQLHTGETGSNQLTQPLFNGHVTKANKTIYLTDCPQEFV
ncbi:unnamed protein product [Owenia fusiformis]|uniref:G-protein coupled receptors family 1 profile domain-containing protein n=1 Tax=Owenia fusiformis TaxID=6347 RepID=A0A8S4N502_OWEFU|nr:unnamed protein product [Owenia fusiformis]